MTMLNGQVILEEGSDDDYEPTEKDIHEYATVIGIDPVKEFDLLWIAREGINAPLPPVWRPCKDLPTDNIYYYNFLTSQSTWDHPSDEFYRNMVIEERHKRTVGSNSINKKPEKKKKNKSEGKKENKPQAANTLSPGRANLLPLPSSPSPLSPIKLGSLTPLRSFSTPGMPAAVKDQPQSKFAGGDTGPTGSLVYEESDDSEHDGDGDRMFHYHMSDEDEEEYVLEEHLVEKLQAMDMSNFLSGYGSGKNSPMKDAGKKKSPIVQISSNRDEDMERQLQLLEERSNQNLALFQEKVDEELEEARLELEEEKKMKLEQARKEMEKLLEGEKKRLSQEKDTQLKSLQEKLLKDMKDEEARLQEKKRKDLKELEEKLEKEKQLKEKQFKEEMEQSLSKLRVEVDELKANEHKKLEKEKAITLQKIKMEVETSVTRQKEELEKQTKIRIEQFKEQLEERHKQAITELESNFVAEQEKFTNELKDKHHKELEHLEFELHRLKEQETNRKESEIKLLRDKQKTLEELERGLQSILMEKKREIREHQQQELDTLRADHDQSILKLKQEYRNKEVNETKVLIENLELSRKKTQQQHELELGEIIRRFDDHKKRLQKDQEVEELQMNKKLELLVTRRQDLEDAYADFDKDEQQLTVKKQKYLEEASWLDNELPKLTNEAEQLRQECADLKATVLAEKNSLSQMQNEKLDLDDELKKLRRRRELYSRKISSDSSDSRELSETYTEVKNHVNKKQFTSEVRPENEQSSIASSNDIENSVAIEEQTRRCQSSITPATSDLPELKPSPPKSPSAGDIRVRRRRGIQNSNGLPNESESRLIPPSSCQRNSLQFHSWDEVSLSESSMSEAVPKQHQRSHDAVTQSQDNIHKTLLEESNAISRARDFLRKHKSSLRRRQLTLQQAQQELHKDIVKSQTIGPSNSSASVLEDIKLHLEREALDLDRFEVNMRAGKRLLKEKEKKLKILQSSLDLDTESSSSDEFSLGKSERRRGSFTLDDMRLDLSLDSEHSSGVGSDTNDNFMDLKKHSNHLAGNNNRPSSVMLEQNSDISLLATSLHRINGELARVLNMLSKQNPIQTNSLHPTLISSSGNVPFNVPLNIVPYQPAHLQRHFSSPQPPPPSPTQTTWRNDNPYKLDGDMWQSSSSQESTEEVLQKKWKSYFGDLKAPLPVSIPPTSCTYNQPSIRDHLQSIKDSRYEKVKPEYSTAERLAEHRRWLKSFETGLNLSLSTANIKMPDSIFLNEVNNRLNVKPAKNRTSWFDVDKNNQLTLRDLNS